MFCADTNVHDIAIEASMNTTNNIFFIIIFLLLLIFQNPYVCDMFPAYRQASGSVICLYAHFCYRSRLPLSPQRVLFVDEHILLIHLQKITLVGRGEVGKSLLHTLHVARRSR